MTKKRNVSVVVLGQNADFHLGSLVCCILTQPEDGFMPASLFLFLGAAGLSNGPLAALQQVLLSFGSYFRLSNKITFQPPHTRCDHFCLPASAEFRRSSPPTHHIKSRARFLRLRCLLQLMGTLSMSSRFSSRPVFCVSLVLRFSFYKKCFL